MLIGIEDGGRGAEEGGTEGAEEAGNDERVEDWMNFMLHNCSTSPPLHMPIIIEQT